MHFEHESMGLAGRFNMKVKREEARGGEITPKIWLNNWVHEHKKRGHLGKNNILWREVKRIVSSICKC